MAYVKTTWIDDETVVNASRMNHIEDGIKNLESVSLLAVSDTAPSECVEGDLYYNTTTKKIYQAIDTDTWDSDGTDPIDKILYIVFSTKTTYSLDENGDLISVGGGGAEIAVSTTEPEEDEVLWIDPEEDSVEAEGTYISNSYGISTEKGYSQEYLNGKVLYENSTGASSDNIILNDTYTNYSRICIYSDLGYIEILPAIQSEIFISQVQRSDTWYYLTFKITFSGTTATISNNYAYYLNGEHNGNAKVYKIVGYK